MKATKHLHRGPKTIQIGVLYSAPGLHKRMICHFVMQRAITIHTTIVLSDDFIELLYIRIMFQHLDYHDGYMHIYNYANTWQLWHHKWLPCSGPLHSLLHYNLGHSEGWRHYILRCKDSLLHYGLGYIMKGWG